MIYAERMCKLPICPKRSGKHDIMLFDLYRLLVPDESALIWIRPDVEDLAYDKKTYGTWFEKPKEPHILLPESVQYIHSVNHTTYRSLKRSVEASIKRLNLPLKLSTTGRKPIITRLPDPQSDHGLLEA